MPPFFKITIEHSLEHAQNINVSHTTNLHKQGYINYCIEHKFNVIIPVYDYKNCFTYIDQIQKMVDQLI
jgi:hypothetical protein